MDEHEVTMITGLTLESQKMSKNYTEVLIEPEYDYWKHIHEVSGTSSIYDLANDASALMKIIQVLGGATTEHALTQPNVQAIINAKKTKGVYDLLLVEQFFQDAFLDLAHVYDIPVISTATFAQQNYMSQIFGIITPWSYVPFNLMPFTDRMNFWEPLSLQMDFDREMNNFPEMDKFVKKYFAHLAIDFQSTSDMSRNLSAILINSYAPLALPAPTIDNMIRVGGMHNKPLPEDIKKFIDETELGVSYLSLGSQVQSKDLPHEKLEIFLDVFRNIKQCCGNSKTTISQIYQRML